MNGRTPWVLSALVLALLAVTIPAIGDTLTFYRTASIPELGISNYNGVSSLRLNDGVGLNSPMPTGDQLFAGDSGNDADNRSLVGFDLRTLTGWTITGDATLRLRVSGVDGSPNAGDFFDVYAVHPTNATWAAGVSSWSNLDEAGGVAWKDGGGADLAGGTSPAGALGQPGKGYAATPLATINQASYAVGTFINVTIPQAALQSMIQDSDPGLLLRSRDETNTGRLAFNQQGSNANGPNLTIQAQAPALSNYGQKVMADGATHYWRLNETGGSIAANQVVPAAYGTYTNAPTQAMAGPTPADGFYGMDADNRSVDFAPSTSQVALPALGISGNSARTYEGWFNATASAQAYLSTPGTGSGKRISLTACNDEVSVAVEGHRFGVTFDTTVGGSAQSTVYTGAPLDAGWHYFAVTFPDGATTSDQFRFYVDGVDRTPYARTLAGSVQTVNTANVAGWIGLGAGGRIDEVAVYTSDIGRQAAAGHFAAARSIDATISQDTRTMGRFLSVSQGNRNDNLWPDESSGTDRASVLQVRERTAAESGSNLRTNAFFEFDLSELMGREVLNATLTLCQDSRNVNTAYLQLARVTDPWDEATLAWDQAVAGAFRFGGTNTPGENDDKPATIDVTDMVRGWVDGTYPNYGFRLAFDEQAFVIADFYSQGEFAPQLTVTTLSVPEPLTALGVLAAASAVGGYLRRRRR